MIPLAAHVHTLSLPGVGCTLAPAACLGGHAVSHVASSAAGSVVGDFWNQFATEVGKAVGEVLKTVTTLWTKIPTTGLGRGGVAESLQGTLWWYMSALAVVSVIIAGGRMAWQQRAEPGRELMRSLLTLVVVNAAGLVLLRVLLQAGDAYSTWVINNSADAQFGKRLGQLVGLSTGAAIASPILIILLGLVVLLMSFLQIGLMVFRSAALVMVAGVLPLSAAATNTTLGKQWFGKILGWTVAFVLYKPAAATIYAAAFLITGHAKGVMGALTGVAAMAMALLAMPALMRLLVPAVGALSNGSDGTAAIGMAAGGGALALEGGRFISSGPSGNWPSSPPQQSSGSTGSQGPTGNRGTGGPTGSAGAAGTAGSTGAAGSAGAAAGGVGVAASAAMKGAQVGNNVMKGWTAGGTGEGGPTGNDNRH